MILGCQEAAMSAIQALLLVVVDENFWPTLTFDLASVCQDIQRIFPLKM
jgi:hypothetical protein